MSGGYFGYQQHHCTNMADMIDEWLVTHGRDESSAVCLRMRRASNNLREAGKMAQRVDWYLSGDDGEESFVRRWDEEIQ